MPMDDISGILPPPPALAPSGDALFLDFDGCLVDIAPRPDAVIVPEGLAGLLAALSGRMEGALAVVSGRSLPEIERFLAGFSGPVVGSHGAEARGLAPPLDAPLAGLAELQREMAVFATATGALYEPKTHGGGLHYRHDASLRGAIETFATDLARRFPGFEIHPAKMAMELRPEGFSKDGALATLHGLEQFAHRRPVFFGDDTTDEPALAWAGAHGGYGVKVGEGITAARHRLPDPASVRRWLRAGLEA